MEFALWAMQFCEFGHTAVQNFGFVTTEGFAYGKQPTELFTCIDELLYFFLDGQNVFLSVGGSRGVIVWMSWTHVGLGVLYSFILPSLSPSSKGWVETTLVGASPKFVRRFGVGTILRSCPTVGFC